MWPNVQLQWSEIYQQVGTEVRLPMGGSLQMTKCNRGPEADQCSGDPASIAGFGSRTTQRLWPILGRIMPPPKKVCWKVWNLYLVISFTYFFPPHNCFLSGKHLFIPCIYNSVNILLCLFMGFVFLDFIYKWNHTVIIFFILTYFI